MLYYKICINIQKIIEVSQKGIWDPDVVGNAYNASRSQEAKARKLWVQGHPCLYNEYIMRDYLKKKLCHAQRFDDF
jgi:hypothetical protein